ncbi:hypothetical protein TUBRATIS_14120 [Tubulinosema ratisbonensis]|uniref:Uncharacterized protein n=1 Tax=Tubulinosema ratisbonensis TaxID=291195 RepID=A0A437ALS8_9MICR|nr:hypothetical protein TUBRATIS_14120 [Tubulinosema ratisbonensis]
MNKENSQNFYNPQEINYVKEKEKLKNEIKKYALNKENEEKIERYVHKYTNEKLTNLEKMNKILYYNLLPDELRKNLKDNSNKLVNYDDSNDEFMLMEISSGESDKETLNEETSISEEVSLEEVSEGDFCDAQNEEFF